MDSASFHPVRGFYSFGQPSGRVRHFSRFLRSGLPPDLEKLQREHRGSDRGLFQSFDGRREGPVRCMEASLTEIY
jgi:hypothetical protein